MGLQPAGRLEVRSLGSVLELAIGGALSVFRREIQIAPQKAEVQAARRANFSRLQTRRTFLYSNSTNESANTMDGTGISQFLWGPMGTKDQRACQAPH